MLQITIVSLSKSGWMEEANCGEWLSKVILPNVEKLLATGPVVLIVDGHGSHHFLAMLQLAKRRESLYTAFHPIPLTSCIQWMWVCLPLLLFKEAMERCAQRIQDKTKAARVDKATFPLLLKQLWDQMKPEHVIVVAGFREAGIRPLNSRVIPEERLLPALMFYASQNLVHSQGQETTRCQ